jgi:sugar phosphate isomerase/epimerase
VSRGCEPTIPPPLCRTGEEPQGFLPVRVALKRAMVEWCCMIEFSVSTSFIRADVSALRHLISLGDFRKLEIGFYDEEMLPVVMDFAINEGLTYGFHDPLPRLPDDTYPFLTDPDYEKRWRTLDSMYRTLQTGTQYAAEYIVGHIPSVIWEPQASLTEEKIIELAHNSCDQLTAWSKESGIPFALENVGPNPYFFEVEAFLQVMEAHPALEFCLDIGHLHLMSIYAGLDPLDFATRLAPFTSIIHVYNATPEMYRRYHHVPAHPSQRPEDGWADIPAILQCALGRQEGTLTVVFEYSPQYPADVAFIKEGIQWVKGLAARE